MARYATMREEDGAPPKKTGKEVVPYEQASASLLAVQTADLKPRQNVIDLGWKDLLVHLTTRLQGLENWRLSWWSHWALLAQYILPRRYHWLVTANKMSKGLPINQNIVDPTGTIAMRTCAHGLLSNLCSPSKPWFKLSGGPLMGEIPYSLQLWFDTVEGLVYQVLRGSNFYNSMKQVFEDLTTFGTAVMIIYEDDAHGIHCYVPCAGEYYLEVSSQFSPQGFFRKFNMTISQIVQMFGIENCSENIRQMWAQKGHSLEIERIVAHAIEPNFSVRGNGGSETRIVDASMPWREVYWLWGENTDRPLSKRGFKTSPVVAPRWATTSNDAYGRSVAMDVLPDIMQLQTMTKREAEAIEKMVRPPLLASIELKNEPSSILPGHVTYVANVGPNTGMRPIYEVKPDIAAMDAKIQQIQTRIKQGFFNDLFMMLQQMEGVQPRNEMEIQARKAEKMDVLGPVIDLWQQEAADPIIHRVLGVLQRHGMLPPMPPEGQAIQWPPKIEYINEFAMMQRGASTATMERVAQVVGSMAPVYPEIIDNLDPDEFVREYADRMTIPHKLLRPLEAITKIRAGRAKEQEQQKQVALASHAAQVAPPAAQQLSQTQVGGGRNALELMLGMGGGNA